MLKKIVENKHFIFVDEVMDWEDALKKSIIPLVKDNSVDEVYGDEIIASVKKHGPYIVLFPGVAMPHSQENAQGVKKTAISFMKTKHKVYFDKDDPESYAKLFFTLASANHDEHLENMSMLAALLENDDVIAELMESEDEHDLMSIHRKYML